MDDLRKEIAKTVCKENGHRYELIFCDNEKSDVATIVCIRCGDVIKINIL